MNEIEKMYKNAGFIQEHCKDYSCVACEQHKKCEKYPPFTVEKQLELTKWMIKINHKYLLQNTIVECFSESLAGILNAYWFSLTEEEKQQVKGILE